ncbi:DUF2637 domain-containing protein [Streptomyces yatensis]|uniref:DUF2637 domain-containing protein n=1 Tax=Streptomyces yatensis TaxID=155177 RepID=A0ABN2INB6_9ACTN|nr:DUF2637 domain-containing protein [Streptomyces yatensis]
MTDNDAIPVRITGWDRAAIVTLGGAGCALSYDALQQMAVAIHIRGLLTYLFPFVIDGFIGYGVRAVLVMRSASLGARCYVWMLFGTATAASIWANALHAVRLNDQPSEGGLRLGDATVGVLSTLAPLALAGAVHLYILIARRSVQPGHPETAVSSDTAAVRTERVTAVPDTRPGRATPNGQDTVPGQGADLAGGPDTRRGHSAPTRTPAPEEPAPDKTTDTDSTDAETDCRTAASEANELLPIARRAVTEAGKLTRKVVAEAIRGQGHPLSNDRLTELMQQLRTEADNRTLRPTG